MMDYRELLEHSYAVMKSWRDDTELSRMGYLSYAIFDFTTYDSGMDELFATKAAEVCAAINDGRTFDYIKDAEDYKWYLLMCNMPFFVGRLNWGGSIRGAWWDAPIGKQMEFTSAGLWVGDKQLTDTMAFSNSEWREFIAAVVVFALSAQEEA